MPHGRGAGVDNPGRRRVIERQELVDALRAHPEAGDLAALIAALVRGPIRVLLRRPR